MDGAVEQGVTHDDVGGQGDTRDAVPDSLDQCVVSFPVVTPPHASQHRRVPALGRDVQLLAHIVPRPDHLDTTSSQGEVGGDGENVDDVLREVLWVWRREANADFVIDRRHGVQQLGEADSSVPSGLVHGREARSVDGEGVPKGSVQMRSACVDRVLARRDVPDCCCATRCCPSRN